MNCNFAHYHADDIPTDKGPKLGGGCAPQDTPMFVRNSAGPTTYSRKDSTI